MKSLAQARRFFGINLGKNNAWILFCDLRKMWRHHFTRSAPFGEKIDEYGLV